MGFGPGLFAPAKTLIESVNTSAGIDELLLAGKVGMALGADLDADVFLRGTSLDHIAAGASDDRLFVLRMDVFHAVHLFAETMFFVKRR